MRRPAHLRVRNQGYPVRFSSGIIRRDDQALSAFNGNAVRGVRTYDWYGRREYLWTPDWYPYLSFPLRD